MIVELGSRKVAVACLAEKLDIPRVGEETNNGRCAQEWLDIWAYIVGNLLETLQRNGLEGSC